MWLVFWFFHGPGWLSSPYLIGLLLQQESVNLVGRLFSLDQHSVRPAEKRNGRRLAGRLGAGGDRPDSELFAAINWLNRNVAGAPVVAEAFTNNAYDQ